MKSAITGEQSVGLFERVSANKKVGHDPIAGAASPSIGSPCDTCSRCGCDFDRRIGDRNPVERLMGGWNVRECGDHLRPHDSAGDQLAITETTPHG